MGTAKKIIGLGVVTGVVMFAYLRSLSGKVNNRILDHKKADAQLV